MEVGRRMGRTPIRAKDSPGFIANRLARPFTLESLRMLADGVADAETIDRVCRLGGGFRMGPFELIDLIGLDVNLSVARSFYAQGGEPERWRPSPIQEQLVAEGRLGPQERRTASTPTAKTNPPPTQLPLFLCPVICGKGTAERTCCRPSIPTSWRRSTRPRTEILPRLIAQIANEAAFALEEQVGSPADMDTAMRLGFNWPLGPLEFAELIGAERAARPARRAPRATRRRLRPRAPALPRCERGLALRDAA